MATKPTARTAFLEGFADAARLCSTRPPSAFTLTVQAMPDTWRTRGFAAALATSAKGAMLQPALAFRRCYSVRPEPLSPRAEEFRARSMAVPAY